MKENLVTLNSLPIGHKGTVVSLETTGTERQRLMDLGLIQGTMVEALHKSPSGDPIAYFIKGTVIALRGCDARKIILSSLA